MNTGRIDQFAPAVAVGDGVSNSLLFIRSLLRELGYISNIYSFFIPEGLRGEVLPAERFVADTQSLLLYHHSMGHDHGDWLLRQRCAKALVYHNITPAEFFAPGSGLREYSELGRRQLRQWSSNFSGSLAVSPLNQQELVESGYCDSTCVPLLIDSDRLVGACERPAFLMSDTRYYLAIGRLAENKRQQLLIEAYYHLQSDQLRSFEGTAHKLILVGGTSSEDYANGLRHHVARLGLHDQVLLPGKCSDAELRWLYRNADQYWCFSAHEGFCMPLIEANHAGTPVIAAARSNIPDTLGEGGLLLDSDDPVDFAVASQQLQRNIELRDAVIEGGRRNLERYARPRLKAQLAEWLHQLRGQQAA